MHWSTLEEVNLSLGSKLKTWNPETGNWNPHPLMHPPFMPLQCCCKCYHLKSLTLSGHYHTTLWWHHGPFWWESLCIHLANWVEVVALSGNAKADALVTPLYKGRNDSPRCILWHTYNSFKNEYFCICQGTEQIIWCLEQDCTTNKW